MTAQLLSVRDLEFMIYELFNVEQMAQRVRFVDHNRETFDAAIEIGRKVAEKYLLPIRQKADINQPRFDCQKVHLISEIKVAIDAIVESGLANAAADYEQGGMQLPSVVANAATSFLIAPGSNIAGYTGLTAACCNLLEQHGSAKQIETWSKPMRAGRFAGTMAMTEPECGSGLGDLVTKALPSDDGNYRVFGNKIFISGGDHELNENIVHLVLARIKGAPKGVKGISLFIVPKFLVNEDASLGERNDVWLAGLFHKMGGRGHTSCAMSFGEKEGALAYLVGEENQGLKYMFHLMNEARIMVGSMASILALTGYQYSLDYAKERIQGRLLSCKDPESPPVSIINHPDVRRMLLAQKAYAEGGYALCLYGEQLSDDERNAPTKEERKRAHLLLNLLTPIIKSWPSEYGPRANSLAIQVMGGHGYINEHPVEMLYRDNRLNPIHEGTYGIQSLDLLARKVPMADMAGFHACIEAMEKTISESQRHIDLKKYSAELQRAIITLQNTTRTLLAAMGNENIDMVLANSVKYLELFGNVIISWIWLRQGIVASKALDNKPHKADEDFYRGKLQALKYFYHFELPEIYAWSEILCALDDTTYSMQEDWF